MSIVKDRVGAPRTVGWMDTVYSITVGRPEGAGIVGVFEAAIPAMSGPPIHIHHNEDEVIHVVDGEFEFWLDGQIMRRSPGNSVFLPRNVPHTFRVVGGRPGRCLAILTPGGLEEFFVEAGSRDLRIPADMGEIAALAGRHGLEFVGPASWPD